MKSLNQEPFLPRFSCTVNEPISPGVRVDRYVSETLKLLSRSQIKARKLRVRINGKEVKISRLLRGGEKLDLFWEDAVWVDLVPEDLPLDIVYEDSRVAVIHKAQGMVVHPGAGNYRGTLANALYYRSLMKHGGLGSMDGDHPFTGLRPGIVHRLDKDTSGLIITAWDEEAHAFLSEQFKKRKVTKTYAAIVQGCPKEQKGRIEMPICRSRRDRKLFTVCHSSDPRGKMSITNYQVARSWANHSLLLLRPKTGRTHQLRVHLRYLGNPILGDPLYGLRDPRFPRQTLMLHAKRLSLVLPESKEKRTFRTPFPSRFQEIFSILKG